MIPAEKKIERMICVSRMYYEQDMTQNEIAKALGISRPLVSVLLTEARACGIVTITINQVESPHQLAAGRLEKRFGLHRALVLPDEDSPDSTDNALAAAAYELCFTEERRAASVGVGWGSMMGRMADHAETLPDAAEHRGRIFPLIGGIGASYRSYHNNEIARIISGKTGHAADYLYFPAFFDSESELEYIKHMDAYQAMQQLWNNMELAVVNISNFPSYPDLGVEYRFDREVIRQHAVGRILAHYFDRSGKVIEPNVDNVMQASLEQLRRTDKVVALCSALLQPKSVIGAVNLGVIDTLVLPLSLADKLLENPE